MSNSEDDTKGFSKLIHVYSAVIFYHGTVKDDFENRWKSLHVVLVKRSMENKVQGSSLGGRNVVHYYIIYCFIPTPYTFLSYVTVVSLNTMLAIMMLTVTSHPIP